MTSHREPLRLLQATALGDAHGLLTEGLTPGRLARRYPQKTPLFGVWPNMALVSDDTEHALLTAHAWACSGRDPDRFVRLLSLHLRKWLWCLPPATGFATARALIKRSAGWPSHRSGVYSAGNGPCMRAPILGSVIDDVHLLWECVSRSTLLTHTHPDALSGAWLLALTARSTQQEGAVPSWPALCTQNRYAAGQPSLPFKELLDQAWASHQSHQTTSQFIEKQGWTSGPTGFVQHTVATALHVLWSDHGTWEDLVRATVRLGGDTDSIAAIVAAIAHLDHSRGDLPSLWRSHLPDGVLTVFSASFLSEVEDAARANTPIPLPTLFWPRLLGCNARMTALVLAHGLGRLLPPW